MLLALPEGATKQGNSARWEGPPLYLRHLLEAVSHNPVRSNMGCANCGVFEQVTSLICMYAEWFVFHYDSISCRLSARQYQRDLIGAHLKTHAGNYIFFGQLIKLLVVTHTPSLSLTSNGTTPAIRPRCGIQLSRSIYRRDARWCCATFELAGEILHYGATSGV